MRNLIAPAFVVLALTLLPAAVQASPGAVVRDCAEDGSLDGRYSDADKRAALKKIPADLAEYSDCKAVISGAIGSGGPKAGSSKNSGGAGGAGDGGSGSSKIPTIDADTNGDGTVTDAEKAAAGRTDLALKQDQKRKNTESSLGGRETDPTKVGAIDASQTSNGMPMPVIASIAALALLAALASLFFLARRKPGFAEAMRSVPLPSFLRR